MSFNYITSVESCFNFIQESPEYLKLVFYSHIPTALVALLIGVFVILKNRRSLISKILLSISISFSLWVLLDLVLWNVYDSRLIMFSWSLLGILDIVIFSLCLYFVHVFIDKKDISGVKKIILGAFMLPVIALTPTVINLVNFDVPNCQATEGTYFTNYYYLLALLIFFWILLVGILRYRKSEKEFKKQIILLIIGIELFLFSFFVTGYLASLIDNFKLEQYGLFGMTVFMGFLAYLIVRFKAFNIKLIGAQALVYSFIILIGSQFFFIQNNTNRILTGITLTIAIGFGIFLIRSIKYEVQRKEELQRVTEKLAVANDELRKLDNAKSEFISIASHQLRTPLTSVKGYVSLLIEETYGKIDPKLMDPLKKIYASNEHLIQLVEELLNVSRIESGRMEYQFAKQEIESLLKEIYDTFAVLAKERGLTLDLKLPPKSLLLVEIDASKTREVISNLIDNALKYTKEGGVTVKAEPYGNFVRVTVSDTGIGVPKEEMLYLFSKFSRGSGTRKLSVSGTGLGLYVGKSMIEAQHGKIWVESEGANKGSRFIVELPVEQPKK